MFLRFLDESWSFFSDHFAIIAWIILPWVVPLEIAATIFEYFVFSRDVSLLVMFLPSLVLLALSLIWSAALIFYIASVASFEPVSVQESWRLGIRHWMPMIMLSVMVYLLMGIGLMLLIIPGIIVGTKLSFAYFELLLNQENPFVSMQLSWRKTRGYFGLIFAAGLIFVVCVWVVYGLLALAFDPNGFPYLFFQTVMNIGSAFLGAFFTVFIFRVYWLAVQENN